MFDPSKLPAEEQDAIRRELNELYLNLGGEDIDRAIARDRKVLAEHERELDHVATLPFDKPYRWRIAPSVGLRAQKDLERQQQRKVELMQTCIEEVLLERGLISEPFDSAPAKAVNEPSLKQAEQLDAFLAEAMDALNDWKQERMEASPPVESAAA
ncbi:MAG: hypothetical protein H6839_09035 [Planctomycetes bacterium]|nr:hypothetical protein [Planctomycetota bacterium]